MDYISELEQLLGRKFDKEEAYEIEQWNNGRALAYVRTFEGFEVILGMLQNYAIDATNVLLGTDPKDVEEVRAAHAVAFSTNRLVKLFIEDVSNAIEASKKTPEPVAEAAKQVAAPQPPDTL